MPRDLDVSLLRTFEAVYRLGSFSRAGEHLGRSQPAISLQIKRLEERLDTRLFQREAPGLVLTPAGRVLLDYAQRMLGLNDDALARLNAPEVTGYVRLGVMEELGARSLPLVLASFMRVFPDATLDLHVKLSSELLSDLMQGRLDLAFVAGPAERDAEHAIPVWREPLVWAGLRSSGPPERLQLALLPEPSWYRAAAIGAVEAAGTDYEVACTASTMVGVKAAAIAGIGVTVLAASDVGGDLRRVSPGRSLPTLPEAQILLYCGTERFAKVADHLAQHIRVSI